MSRAIVVTGASTGIGRATALRLARAGTRVFAGVRSEADAGNLRAERVAGLEPIFLDVTNAEQIAAAAKSVGAALGGEGLAGLVNNAGITMGGPVEFMELSELRRVFEVNTVGPLAVTQAFLPLLRVARGRVVFVSSIGGRLSSPLVGPYSASKFALEALADSLRVEVAPFGIEVSVVEPGAIATPIFEKTRRLADDVLSRVPPHALAHYERMARAVVDAFTEMEKRALPPQRAADAIEHALTARRPRTRYLVGNDARVQALLAWLVPDRPRDGLAMRMFGLADLRDPGPAPRAAAAGSAVVVTGASSGIGRATALHLDRLGLRVFAGVRREADGESLRREASDRLTPLLLDVTHPAQIEAAATAVAEAVGAAGLAGVVNNAGIGVGGPLEFLPLDELRRVLEVNVVGVVAVTQAFLPLVRRAGGRVVVVGSISDRLSAPFAGPYSASKFAVRALTDALRQELRPAGLEVVLVEPGDVATPIWEKTQSYADDLERRLPKEALELYADGVAAIRRQLAKSARGAAPPEGCARAIAHALMARRPRTKYLVGSDARIGALAAALLPDRLRDRIIGRVLSA